MQVRAAVAEGDGSFAIETLEMDPPGPDGVLVEIRASGVCHTDFDPLLWSRRVILGHEGAGVVDSGGAGVAGLASGDRVMLN